MSVETKDIDIKVAWRKQQDELRTQLILCDDFKFEHLRLIGGVDISFVKGTMEACVCLVVKSWPDMVTVYTDIAMVTLTEPYIQGFLAFREIPSLVPLINKLKNEHPDFFPDIILVDGNGLLHPNGFGSACHLGVVCNVPTIGIGKTILYMDSLDKDKVKQDIAMMKECEVGDYRLIQSKMSDGNKILGAILKTVKHDKNASDIGPGTIYVSIGHRISLVTAIAVVNGCIKSKIPEPIREADFLSRKFLRTY